MSILDRSGRRGARSLFATVPLAVVGSLAMALNPVAASNATGEVRPDTARPVTTDATAKATGSVTLGQASGASGASAPHFAEASAPSTYTVQFGDTVSTIASRFGLSTASVLAVNGLSWKSLIFPGQVLALGQPVAAPVAPAPVVIPSTLKHRVVSGETISGIAAAHGVPVQAILSANGLSRASLIFPGQAITIPAMMATSASVTPLAAPAAPAAAPAPAPAAPAAPAPVAPPAAATVVALTDEMRANAAVIVTVGRRLGVRDQAIVIALAAAMQESHLRNLSHGDSDSLGLFQQRPSMGWGPAAQIMDPYTSARAFFGGATNPNKGRTRGLLDIPGWQSMSVTQAAQAVQISAYPNAYAVWEASARSWLGQLR